MSLEKIPYSVLKLQQGVEKMFQDRVEEKGLRWKCNLSFPGNDVIVGDPNRVRQIFINLLGNALKFTESGEVKLGVAIEEKPKPYLCVTVEDSGVGIPFDAQDRLFKKFAQADSSTTRKHGGSGLGLAITERLVSLMGGSIFFSSEEGKGSIFRVRIPTKFASAHELDSLDADKPRQDSLAFDHADILVVDDSLMNQKVVKILLQKMPVTITTADSGENALEHVAQSKFDLILMDCQMPGMDGYETTRRIRSLGSNNPNAHIPVIALTGNVTADGKTLCEQAGMDGFLSKPVNIRSLIKELNKHLSSKPATEQSGH